MEDNTQEKGTDTFYSRTNLQLNERIQDVNLDRRAGLQPVDDVGGNYDSHSLQARESIGQPYHRQVEKNIHNLLGSRLQEHHTSAYHAAGHPSPYAMRETPQGSFYYHGGWVNSHPIRGNICFPFLQGYTGVCFCSACGAAFAININPGVYHGGGYEGYYPHSYVHWPYTHYNFYRGSVVSGSDGVETNGTVQDSNSNHVEEYATRRGINVIPNVDDDDQSM